MEIFNNKLPLYQYVPMEYCRELRKTCRNHLGASCTVYRLYLRYCNLLAIRSGNSADIN